MAEDIEVGGVVLKVRAVAVGVDELLSRMQTAFQQIGKVTQQVLQTSDSVAVKTRETAQQAQNTAVAAASLGANTGGIDKYSVKLDSLSAKYSVQQEKVHNLGVELDKMAQQYADLMMATGGNADFDLSAVFPDQTAKYDAELAKLDDLRNAIQLTEQQRGSAAAKAIATQDVAIQKQEQLNQKMANKSVRADTKLGLDAASMAIRGVSGAAGGAVGNIGYLATEVVYLKKTMDTAASSSAILATAISGGIMIGVTLLASAVTVLQNAEKKRQQAFDAGVSSYQKYNREVEILKKNLSVLKDQTSSTDQLIIARNNLTDTFSDLIIGYTEENEAILATTETIERYLAVQEEKNRLARQEIIDNSASTDEYQKVKAESDAIKEQIELYEKKIEAIKQGRTDDGYFSDQAAVNDYTERIVALNVELSKTQRKLYGVGDNLTQAFNAYVLNNISIEDSATGMIQSYEDMDSASQTVLRQLILNNLEVAKTSDDWGSILADIIDTLSDPSKVKPFYNELVNGAKTQKRATLDAAKSVNDLYYSLREANDEMKDIGAMKAAAAALEAGAGAKNYGDALEYVANKYGVTKEEAAGMAEALREELAIKQTLALTTIPLAQEQVNAQIATVENMKETNQITQVQADSMIASLEKVPTKYAELLNAEGGLNLGKIPTTIPKSSGSTTNEALQNQLSLLENKKAMDTLTYSEEIAWLKRIRSQYAANAEERQDLDEKIYAAKKALLQAELDHKKAMDQLTLGEEIKALENQLPLYKKGTAARIELEEQLYALKKEKAQQDYDLQVHYGKLNLQKQEDYLKRQIQLYKANTAQRIELEKQLFDVQKQIRDQSAQQIGQVADALVTALGNRYEEQRKIEENRIRESIDAWQGWADEQVETLQQQIDALDDLTKEEDRAEEERKRRRKIAALEQQLQYETDSYNQKKLREEIAKAEQELSNWLTKNAREDQKKALQDQIDAVNEKADAEKKKLEDQLDTNDAYFDELTKSYNLQAEAQKLVMKNNQTEIVNLIKAFAPEYNTTGQTLGEQLVDGFTSKVKDVETWFNTINTKIQAYQNTMSLVATQAADTFWQNRGTAPSGMQTAPATAAPPSIVINFNQPVESPVQTARALTAALEQLYTMQ